MRVLHLAGPSSLGKTRLIEALLDRVPAAAVVKWSHHPLPEDEPLRDTGRFAAHKRPTLLVTPTGLVERRPIGEVDRRHLYHRLAHEWGREDLLIMEGDKWAPYPKIWIGSPPPPGLAAVLVIGPEPPDEAIEWMPATLPLDEPMALQLAQRLAQDWQHFSYELSVEEST